MYTELLRPAKGGYFLFNKVLKYNLTYGDKIHSRMKNINPRGAKTERYIISFAPLRLRGFLFNKVQAAQECDATEDDQKTESRVQKYHP